MPELVDLRPMLLGEVPPSLAPDGPNWAASIKFDGYRIVAAVDGDGRVVLRSKNGADATAWYPELQSLAALPPWTVLDGEAAVLDALGRADFDKLHARSRRRRRSPGDEPVVFCAFDLLQLRGKDLRAWTLRKRKRALEQLLEVPPPHVLYVQDVVGEVHWLYDQARALMLEGVVAKRLDSPYRSGERSDDWVKIKRPNAIPPERFRRGAK